MPENEFDVKKQWLPFPEVYDLPSKANHELHRFLSAPIIPLSKDYRKPDDTTLHFWSQIIETMEHHDGLWMELGVFEGTSINTIAAMKSVLSKDSSIYGFDCWTGLPEKWRDLDKGEFEVQEKPAVREGVELIDGLFSESLPTFMNRHSDEHISLLHIDCDLYSSTMTAFDNLYRFFVPGTIIVFDEFALWPGFYGNKESEFEALIDASEKYGFKYEYVGRGWDAGRADCVKVEDILKKGQWDQIVDIAIKHKIVVLDWEWSTKHSAREKAIIKIV